MIDKNNPAGRLYDILQKAKGRPDTEQTKTAWSKVLDIDDNDILITKAVIGLHSLSEEIQSIITMNSQLNHALYLKSFNRINNALFPLHLYNQWSTVKGHLTEEALTRLQFCAEELSTFYSEETLSTEDLNEIIKIIEELFEAVFNSSLPDLLRLTLLEEIERLRNSITLYKIKGARGLKQALQATIGAVVANQEELKCSTKNNLDVLTRLGELIDKLDSFTSRALKLQKILTKPIGFLIEKITNPDKSDEEA